MVVVNTVLKSNTQAERKSSTTGNLLYFDNNVSGQKS